MTEPRADEGGDRTPLRVLHLVGSPVDDFHADLSRLYARDALAALAGGGLDGRPYEHVVAHVAPGGAWSFPEDLSPAALAAAATVPVAVAVARLRRLAPDLGVPQMFCPPGMTTYRSLLDLLGVPLVGNRAETMALGMSKPRSRAVVAAAAVAVPEGEVLAPGEEPTLEPPVVVKPADADNSAGVSLVREESEYAAALAAARAVGPQVLVERYVELGREVRCGVVDHGDGSEAGLEVLPLEEYAVDPDHKPIRDAADKLARDPDGELRLVAKDTEHAWLVPPGDPVNEAVARAARAAYRALGCRHYGLFDFRVDATGEPWFLEAGLYCSFARSSVVAVMAAAAGQEVDDLFATAARLALTDRTGRR